VPNDLGPRPSIKVVMDWTTFRQRELSRRHADWTDLPGTAGEALGYDRYLKSNTTNRLTHSLFHQGSRLYDLIPTMPEQRLVPLIKRFAAMLAEVSVFADTFGVV
jgi:hypothetical protein